MYRRAAFTLIEMLVVIAIIALLAGLLFPVFARARAKGRETACLSNIRQIGMAIMMYAEDWDERYPFAVDPTDRYTPQIWNEYPEWQQWIPYMPMLHEALQPYCRSMELWHCPSDIGYVYQDFNCELLDTTPSSYQKFGTSYVFRTEIAFRQMILSSFQYPAEVNVIMDSSGAWHGSEGIMRTRSECFNWNLYRGYRYNVLFGDGHAKNITYFDLDRAWSVPL